MLGGDGQHGAVKVDEEGEEGDKEVELGEGEVAKVHRVEHQHSTAHVDRAEKRCSPGREFQKWQKVKMSSPARRQSFKE